MRSLRSIVPWVYCAVDWCRESLQDAGTDLPQSPVDQTSLATRLPMVPDHDQHARMSVGIDQRLGEQVPLDSRNFATRTGR